MHDIRTAVARDVHSIASLLDLCFDANGAGLAQRFDREQIASFTTALPCPVAAAPGDRIEGILIAQPVPRGNEAGPVTQAMLQAFPPPPGSYVYGPIAIAPAARGQGLVFKLGVHLRASLPGRTGILFVDERNVASLRAHGGPQFRRLGRFVAGGIPFACLVTGP